MKRANVMEIAMDVVPKRNADRKVVDQVLNADQKEVTDRKVVDPVHNAGLKGVDRRTSEVLSLEDPGGVVLKGVSLG